MMNSCSHPGFFGSLCTKCGKVVDNDDSGVPFRYVHKNLRLSKEEVTRLRNKDQDKKLYLVLDLDHTLLNSTILQRLTTDEKYLMSGANSEMGISSTFITYVAPGVCIKGSPFTLNSTRMTKLRPFVHTFLKEASEMFEMYIYTMGNHFYASEMVKLLDPKSEYFISRVISRDESTQKRLKDLDLVLGKKSAILILDDTENVWPGCKDNLILMERYHFFASSCRKFGFNHKSLSEMRRDESESCGALATALKILRQIHDKFFYEFGDDLASRDVRQLLKTLRKKVLKNCIVVFSSDVSKNFPAAKHQKKALELGATCSTIADLSVTHVVSTDVNTEEALWAVKENKFLVHPHWIEAANYLWKKQPEENFSINKNL